MSDPLFIISDEDQGMTLERFEKRFRRMESTLEKIENDSRSLEDKIQPVSSQMAQLRNELNACVQYMVNEIAPRIEGTPGDFSGKAGGIGIAQVLKELQEKTAALDTALAAVQEKFQQAQERTAGHLGTRTEEQFLRLQELEARFKTLDQGLQEARQNGREEQKVILSGLDPQLKMFEDRVKALENEVSQGAARSRGELNSRLGETQARLERTEKELRQSEERFAAAEAKTKGLQDQLRHLSESFKTVKESLRADLDSQRGITETNLKELQAQIQSGVREGTRAAAPGMGELERKVESLERLFEKSSQAGEEKIRKMASEFKLSLKETEKTFEERFRRALSAQKVPAGIYPEKQETSLAVKGFAAAIVGLFLLGSFFYGKSKAVTPAPSAVSQPAIPAEIPPLLEKIEKPTAPAVKKSIAPPAKKQVPPKVQKAAPIKKKIAPKPRRS